jgi:hypothetical protein
MEKLRKSYWGISEASSSTATTNKFLRFIENLGILIFEFKNRLRRI